MPMLSYFQLLNPLVFSLASMAFLSVSVANPRACAAGWISASYAFGAAAFSVDFFRNYLPAPIGAFGSNALYASTAAIFGAGYVLRYRDHAPIKILGGAAVLAFVAYLILVLAMPGMWPHTFAINFGAGSIFAIAAIYAGGGPKKPIDYVAHGLVWLMAAQAFIRPLLLYVVDRGELDASLYTQSTFFLTLHLVVGSIAIATAMALLVAFSAETIEALSRQSTTDPLSGVLNRRGFEEAARAAFAAADADQRPVGVIIGDIDNFKRVNDAFGHGFGDQVISATGLMFRNFSQAGRVAGRLGGEEFAMLLPGASLDDTRNVAEAMRRRFADTRLLAAAAEHAFTASFGVAARRPGEPLSFALDRADAALNLAKTRGRDRVATEVEAVAADPAGALQLLERRRRRARFDQRPSRPAPSGALRQAQ